MEYEFSFPEWIRYIRKNRSFLLGETAWAKVCDEKSACVGVCLCVYMRTHAQALPISASMFTTITVTISLSMSISTSISIWSIFIDLVIPAKAESWKEDQLTNNKGSRFFKKSDIF